MELVYSRTSLSNLCEMPSLNTQGPKYVHQESIPWGEFVKTGYAVPVCVQEDKHFWNKCDNLNMNSFSVLSLKGTRYCSKHSASKWTTLKALALWRFIEENKEANLGTRGHKKHLWGFKVIRSPRPSAPDLEPSSHYSSALSRPHQRPLVGTKGAFPGGF